MRIVTKFNNIGKITPQAEELLYKVVRKTAFDIQALAVNKAPVETGALRASIHVVTFDYDGYGAAVGGASGRRGDARFAASETVKNELNAKVVVPIHYGIFHELGWAKRPAKPYLEPAAMEMKGPWEAALTYVLGGLGS